MKSSCPDVSTLQQFELGRLEPMAADRCAEHVIACDRCIAELERAEMRDTLTDSLRSRATDVEPLHSPRLSRMIDRVQGQLDDGQHGRRERYREEVLQLLQTSDRAGMAGRLDDYHVEDIIDVGGMGVVLRAVDGRDDRPVAIKIMHPALATSATSARRFEREARSIGQLDHPHVVPVVDVRTADGVPYFVMPLLSGETLHRRLQRKGRLPAAQAVAIARQICAALRAAHSDDMLHRDVKPENIWLESPADRVRLLDFGLTRAAETASSLTGSGTIVGTPQYMAPEQARGDRVDARTDLFSLGCVLYQMLTGESPFASQTIVGALYAVSNRTVSPPDAVCADVPQAISQLVMRLLSKDPQERPASAEEVEHQLSKIAAAEVKVLRRRDVPQSASSRIRWYAWFITFVAAASLAALASRVFIGTDHGVIAIDLERDAEVVVRNRSIVLRDRSSGATVELEVGTTKLEAGHYELSVKDLASGIAFSGGRVTLSRDGRKLADISLQSNVGDSDSTSPADKQQNATAEGDESSRDATEPAPGTRRSRRRQIVAPGSPFSRRALVREVPQIGGPKTWTVEPIHHRGDVSCIAYDPNQQRMATGGVDGTIRIWPLGSRRPDHIIVGHDHAVGALAWSPDGKLLAASDRQPQGDVGAPGTTRVWSIGERIRQVDQLVGESQTLLWSPHGDILATDGWQLWRALDGSVLANSGMAGAPMPGGWSKSGALSGADQRLHLWDVTAAREIHGFGVQGLVYARWLTAPDQFAAVSFRRGARVEFWKASTLERLKVCLLTDVDEDAVSSLKISPDGRFACFIKDNILRVWRLEETPKLQGELRVSQGRSPVWSPRSDEIALISDGRVLRVAAADVTRRSPLLNEPPRLAFSASGESFHFVTRSLTEATPPRYLARLWRVGDPRPFWNLTDAEGLVHAAASPDGKYVALVRRLVPESSDGTSSLPIERLGRRKLDYRVQIMRTGDKALVIEEKITGRSGVLIRWSQDSANLLVSGIELASYPTAAMVLQVEPPLRTDIGGSFAQWSSDGRQVARILGNRLSVWRPGAGDERELSWELWDAEDTPPFHPTRGNSRVLEMAFAPLGNFVATVDRTRSRLSDGVRMWRTQPAPEPAGSHRFLVNEFVRVYNATFSPQGTKLALTGYRRPQRDIEPMEFFAELHRPDGERPLRRIFPDNLRVAPKWVDDRTLLLAQRDRVLLWDTEADRVTTRLVDHAWRKEFAVRAGDYYLAHRGQVERYRGDELLETTLAVGKAREEQLVTVRTDGTIVMSGSADPELRMVVLEEQGQRTLTMDEFSRAISGGNSSGDGSADDRP